MLITCKNKTVKIHSEISFNTIHSSKSFDVVIDSSIDDRKAFMRQMLKHMNEVRADGFSEYLIQSKQELRRKPFLKPDVQIRISPHLVMENSIGFIKYNSF